MLSTPGALILNPTDLSAGKFFVIDYRDGRLFAHEWDHVGGRWRWQDCQIPAGSAAFAKPGALILDPGDRSAGKFFVGTTDGRLLEHHWDHSRGRWLWTDHGAPNGTDVSTAPGALILYPGDQSAGKFFVGTTNGHLFERFWNLARRRWEWNDHGAPNGTGVLTAPGALVLYPNDASAGKFFVGTTDGRLFEHYWDSASRTWLWGDHGWPQASGIRFHVESEPNALILDPGDPSAGKFFIIGAARSYVHDRSLRPVPECHLLVHYWDHASSQWLWADHGTPTPAGPRVRARE